MSDVKLTPENAAAMYEALLETELEKILPGDGDIIVMKMPAEHIAAIGDGAANMIDAINKRNPQISGTLLMSTEMSIELIPIEKLREMIAVHDAKEVEN